MRGLVVSLGTIPSITQREGNFGIHSGWGRVELVRRRKRGGEKRDREDWGTRRFDDRPRRVFERKRGLPVALNVE